MQPVSKQNIDELSAIVCRKFIYPSISSNTQEFQVASFQHIEEIFHMEATMTVKMAHKHNNRVINPSNIERQSAMLTTAIFHESTINALKFYSQQGRPDFMETAEFLAKQKCDEFREVVSKENLVNKTSFLRSFVDWLSMVKTTSSNPQKIAFSV